MGKHILAEDTNQQPAREDKTQKQEMCLTDSRRNSWFKHRQQLASVTDRLGYPNDPCAWSLIFESS